MGGHAEYLLRVFHMNNQKLERATLENTPDVDRINRDPQLKADLISYLNNQKNMHRLSAGIFILPERFLATKASSYSPYGFSRKANRLFDQILSENDLAAGVHANLREDDIVSSAHSALKRLNDLSCVGCHQARAEAGFHFLGIDRQDTFFFNAITFEGSGHFSRELKRRKIYLNTVLEGQVPNPFREFSFSPAFTNEFLNHVKGAPKYQKAGFGVSAGELDQSLLAIGCVTMV